MELVVYLCLGLALWAMLVPFRLLFTTWGIKKRGRKLFVVLLLFVGLDVPERWMQTVERYERAKGGEAGEACRGRATEARSLSHAVSGPALALLRGQTRGGKRA